MNVISGDSFDDRQQRLTAAILEAIWRELRNVDLPADLARQLTGSIEFAVTALIDDSSSVSFGDGELCPMLTFQVSDDELAYGGGNTWMHEYVYRLLPDIVPDAG